MLGADKEKVHRDQTLGNTGGNNNKDAMFDWRIRSGCQSEDKCKLSYSCDLYHDYYMFLHKQRTLSAIIFLLLPLVLCFSVVSGYIRMLCGNVCVVLANIKTRTCGV